VARQKYWDLYDDCEHLLPEVPAFAYEQHDAHSRRIFDANDWRSFTISEQDIRRSRQAYFANISYLDDKIGQILEVLETTEQEADILFVSDHGDMLGERGLWFKMSMFDGSSRVPMMISAPDLPAGRIDTPVSTIDVCPTLAELAGADMQSVSDWTEGRSLLGVARGAVGRGPVAIEYAAEASYAPVVALRDARYKYVRCTLDPEQLFDLVNDPHELNNLAQDKEHADVLQEMRELADSRWDLERFDADVRRSQARRWVVYGALRNGAYYPWDYQPLQKASDRYMRNHMDLNEVEHRQRFPRGD